jgi:hypothetical protein
MTQDEMQREAKKADAFFAAIILAIALLVGGFMLVKYYVDEAQSDHRVCELTYGVNSGFCE